MALKDLDVPESRNHSDPRKWDRRAEHEIPVSLHPCHQVRDTMDLSREELLQRNCHPRDAGELRESHDIWAYDAVSGCRAS